MKITAAASGAFRGGARDSRAVCGDSPRTPAAREFVNGGQYLDALFKRRGAEENREVRRECFPLRSSTLLLCASAF